MPLRKCAQTDAGAAKTLRGREVGLSGPGAHGAGREWTGALLL